MAFLENRIFCIWGLYDVSSQLDQVMHLHSEYHIRDSVFLTHHTRIQILSITQSRCSMISYSHYFFPFLLVIWGEGSLLKTIQWPLSLSKYPLRFFFSLLFSLLHLELLLLYLRLTIGSPCRCLYLSRGPLIRFWNVHLVTIEVTSNIRLTLKKLLLCSLLFCFIFFSS